MNKYAEVVRQLSDKAGKLPEADFGLKHDAVLKEDSNTGGSFYYKPKSISRLAAAMVVFVCVAAVGVGAGKNSEFRKAFHAFFTPENGAAQSGLPAEKASNAALTAPKEPSGLPAVPFTMGVYKNINSKSYHAAPDFSAQIIRSMEELQEKYRADEQAINYIQKYNDSFFDNHAIVFIVKKHTSGSIRDRINSISKSGNQLVIDYTTIKPTLQTADLACWRILLEVKKSDIVGVVGIASRQHEETLPDGVSFQDNSLEYLGA